ncbi:hypothetical protein EYF80_056230 [Liparis tanakae]|uniref:Uncharacterized protein n=1 Tax=Liparis tanakae TaxID=230148 RepID=A0A4Z2EYE5_9TELE|nr:hypothetical protein EYF80_056230 [Liparis tanakae]
MTESPNFSIIAQEVPVAELHHLQPVVLLLQTAASRNERWTKYGEEEASRRNSAQQHAEHLHPLDSG